MDAAVVERVTMMPTRVNSQNVMLIFLLACCRTMRFATELSGVKLPASVLALASASHTKWLCEKV